MSGQYSRYCLLLLACGLSLCWGSIPASAAPMPAIVDFQRTDEWPFPGVPQPGAANSDSTIGWSFAVTVPVNVVRLGFYDQGIPGLTERHRVGIWDGQGELLGSCIVDTGTLIGGYRYVTIPAMSLATGGSYTIGATVPMSGMTVEYTDRDQRDWYPFYDVVPDSIVADPRVVPAVWALEYPGQADPFIGSHGPGTLHFPSTVPPTGGGHFLAANFQFEELPEPSTALLLSFGALTMSMARKETARAGRPRV